MAKFEAQVEKLCADWTESVAGILEKCFADVWAKCAALDHSIIGLSVPEGDPKDIQKVPQRINELLRQESKELKPVVELALLVKIDAKSRKLTSTGPMMSGDISKLK